MSTDRHASKGLTPTGERADGRTGLIINENGRVPTKIFDYYEAILYAFYNREIKICDTDMSSALSDCVGMLEVATYLGCINVISKPVEVALSKHGQPLFRAIQAQPAVWATTSLMLQSETIFRESLVHLAGNWKKLRTDAATMERLREKPIVRQLAENYHRKLMARGKALELSVMSIYPGDMCTPSQDLPIKREDYSRDILVWMALTFFRHWLGQRIVSQKGYHSDDSGCELYRQLGTAGEAYMDKSVMNQFHAKFPMTKKAMNVLENHLLEIKECIKGMVDKHGILASTCQLDVHRFPVAYLTCVEVEREDYPWLRKERVGTGVGARRERRMGGNEIARENLEKARKAQEERGESMEVSEDESEENEEGAGRLAKRARCD